MSGVLPKPEDSLRAFAAAASEYAASPFVLVAAFPNTDGKHRITGDILHTFGGCLSGGGWTTFTDDDGNTESVSLSLIHKSESKEAAEHFQQLAAQAGGIVLAEDVTLPFVVRLPDTTCGIWYGLMLHLLSGTELMWWVQDHPDAHVCVLNPFVGAAETWKRLLSQAKQTEGTSTTEYHAAMDAAGLTGDATDDAEAVSDSQPDKIPTLSERKYLILQALLEMGATSADARQTTVAVVERTEGKAAEPVHFKTDIASLKGADFIDTKEGRGGGCWLTAKGRNLAKRLVK
tara:strand:+ start:957 stop:1823 length:867 start_codon:yes stop_codon:yes gene_type:complete